MNELWAAIIGAIVGGLVGGIFTYVASRKQVETSQEQADRARTWEIASAAATVQSEILNVSTPNNLKGEDVARLRVDWDRTNRKLYFLGYKDIAEELTDAIRSYLDVLQDFFDGELDRTQLEERRRWARDRVADTMNKLISE